MLLVAGHVATAVLAGALAGVAGWKALPVSNSPFTDMGLAVGQDLRPLVLTLAVAALCIGIFLDLPF